MNELMHWSGQPKSSFYYKPGNGKPGRKPSTHTRLVNGEMVENEVVVTSIKKILSHEFLVCAGYQKIVPDLKEMFIINHKKVYRLMNEANLLFGKKIRPTEKRKFVEMRKVTALHPMQQLAMDIKYIYIHGERRNVYLLTVLDVCTRKALGHLLKPSIRKHDVVLLLESILQEYKVEGITIRNDNGSQFIAGMVREYLKSKKVNQEFTHIATPEENAYIEALHSILEREVIRRYWFDSFNYAKWKIDDFYKFYNSRRRHRSLKMLSPEKYWQLFFPDYLPHSDKAKSGSFVKGSEERGTCEALDKNEAFATFVGVNKPLNLLN